MPNCSVKVYLTNHLANGANERCIEKLRTKLRRDTISIYVKDSARDIETQTLTLDTSDNQIHKSGNLPGKLKVCIGARVILAGNISTSDHLINRSTGKIEFMERLTAASTLVGIIYVKFGDADAGDPLKNNLLRNELKEYVPITAITKEFPYWTPGCGRKGPVN